MDSEKTEENRVAGWYNRHMDTEYRMLRGEDSSLLLDFMKAVAGDTDNLAFTVPEAEALDEGSERLFIAEARKSQSVFAAAITDGIISGTCEIRISSGHARTRHRGELAIAVRKEYWGTGIAQHLLDFALSEARERGVRKISLSVRSDNARAKAFYERNGFVHEGHDPMLFFIDGFFVDGEHYGLVIPER